MTSKDTIKQFEEMFSLTTEDDENSQAEEYGHSTESELSFDDLAAELQSEIEKMPERGSSTENPHDIVKDVCSKTYETEVELIKEEQKLIKDNNTLPLDDDFDELSEDDIIKKDINKKEVVEEIKETLESFEETPTNSEAEELIEVLEDNKDPQPEPVVENITQIVDDKIQWNFKSPACMYDNFYKQKEIFIKKYMVGGQIEYLRWTNELLGAQVNVVTEVFDQQVIIKQMEAVQQYRGRVKYIGVRINNQYFLFDRFVGLLRGYLARVQYLKPVLKQDGLILEHMGDIELYFERLRALHKSVADTEKNLAAAYEMLSRKVTICMELPPAERYERPSSSYGSRFSYVVEKEPEAKPTEEMDGFDDLPDGAKAGPKEHKIGRISWSDF